MMIDKTWNMRRGIVIVVICACVASSVNARIGFMKPRNRNSGDIAEDAKLNVPHLIRKYGYPVEVHDVTTEDGYILQIHRIPHGRDSHNVPKKDKTVVFLMHGFLCSSADWVIMGPGLGFAYILAELGFDVWMGNARGNSYSRRHMRLKPDAILNTAFWKFSWNEIGNIDLPTMIDHVLKTTKKRKLHYVGHSQGTTSFFVMTSLRPDYNKKITSMNALAPVAYMAHNKNPLLKVIAPFSNNIEKISGMLGKGEFLPNMLIMSWAGQKACLDGVLFQPACSNILFLIGGFNEQQQNKTMLPVIFGHFPAGAAMRQLAHYGQGIVGQDFRQYDQGTRLGNRRYYGTTSPPKYDLSKITCPVFLHYSDSDPLAHVYDVDRLYNELGRPLGKYRIPMTTFSHLDFLFGISAKELVYNKVIDSIYKMERNGTVKKKN